MSAAASTTPVPESRFSAWFTHEGLNFTVEAPTLDKLIGAVARITGDEATPLMRVEAVAKTTTPVVENAPAKPDPKPSAPAPQPPAAASAPKAAATSPTAEAAVAAAPEQKAPAYAQVAEVVTKLYAKNAQAVVEVFAKFGVKHGKELKAEQYAAFIDACKAKLAELGG